MPGSASGRADVPIRLRVALTIVQPIGMCLGQPASAERLRSVVALAPKESGVEAGVPQRWEVNPQVLRASSLGAC